MYNKLNRSLPPVPVSNFSMVPRSDVPRSKFRSESAYRTTFDADFLIPVFVEEVLPGDHFHINATCFMRMGTPIFPIMDNVYLDAFFFFVPNRINWTNWVKFMGEQTNPADTISYTIPQLASTLNGGFAVNSLGDYFGLPVVGTQVTVQPFVNALPFRAYNDIWNEWFRDQNLQNSAFILTDGSTSGEANYPLLKRNKRPDYFTSSLPWPLKGGVSVPIPFAGTAAVKTGVVPGLPTGAQAAINILRSDTGGSFAGGQTLGVGLAGNAGTAGAPASTTNVASWYPSNLYADLSTATGATINSMRLAVATQQFLEKDARGGTRYTELLRNHFGVAPQDSRLQRPEYCGGGSFMLQTQAIPQTAPTTGPVSPLGTLAGATIGSGQISASYAAAEHGFIMGLVAVRADITYQQGIHRMWTRTTRFDYYFPTFAFLGEQVVRQDEIYATGVIATDTAAFGYQERWAEYRYRPGRITGKFRGNIAGTFAPWTLSQYFSTPPALNTVFITSNTPMTQVLAAGASTGNQFLFDSVWHVTATRPLPARSVPGLARF